MSNYEYTVVIEPGENFGFVATCPDLLGCVTQGDTVEETVEHMREAMSLFIETLRECGDPIPAPRHVHTTIIAVAV